MVIGDTLYNKINVEKFHILRVLEDGSFLDAHEVRRRLRRVFGVDCKIDSLRKGLLRLCRQGLLAREKLEGARRSYHYRIREKGRKRLAIFRERKKQEPEATADLQRLRQPLKSNEERRLFDRWIEAVGSLKLIDVLLRHPLDDILLNSAIAMKVYWWCKLLNIYPNLPVHLQQATEQVMTYQCPVAEPYIKIEVPTFDILLRRIRRPTDERDYLHCSYQEERSEKETYKRLYEEKDAECRKLSKGVVARSNVQRSSLDSFELERVFEKTRATADSYLSVGKIISSRLKERSARQQKEREHFQALLLRRYVNERWWDLMPSGYGSRLPPVRGPARGSEPTQALQNDSRLDSKESVPSGSFESRNKSWPARIPPVSLEAPKTMRKASAEVPMICKSKLVPKRTEREPKGSRLNKKKIGKTSTPHGSEICSARHVIHSARLPKR